MSINSINRYRNRPNRESWMDTYFTVSYESIILSVIHALTACFKHSFDLLRHAMFHVRCAYAWFLSSSNFLLPGDKGSSRVSREMIFGSSNFHDSIHSFRVPRSARYNKMEHNQTMSSPSQSSEPHQPGNNSSSSLSLPFTAASRKLPPTRPQQPPSQKVKSGDCNHREPSPLPVLVPLQSPTTTMSSATNPLENLDTLTKYFIVCGPKSLPFRCRRESLFPTRLQRDLPQPQNDRCECGNERTRPNLLERIRSGWTYFHTARTLFFGGITR